MITENIIKEKFIADTISTNFARLKERQLEILSGADEKIRKKFNIPKIANRVLNRVDKVTAGNGGITLSQTNIIVLRILDMRKFGNMKIYNRPVWGYIYSDIANNLKYGFSDTVKAGIREQLEYTINARW